MADTRARSLASDCWGPEAVRRGFTRAEADSMTVTKQEAKKQRMLVNHAIKWCRYVFTMGAGAPQCAWADVSENDAFVFPAVAFDQGQLFHFAWDKPVQLEWRALAASLPDEDKDIIFANDETIHAAIIYPGSAKAGHWFMGSENEAWEFAFVGPDRLSSIRPDSKGRWPTKQHVSVTTAGEDLQPAGVSAQAKKKGQKAYHGPAPPDGKGHSWFQYGGWADEGFLGSLRLFIEHQSRRPIIYAPRGVRLPRDGQPFDIGDVLEHPPTPLAPAAACSVDDVSHSLGPSGDGGGSGSANDDVSHSLGPSGDGGDSGSAKVEFADKDEEWAVVDEPAGGKKDTWGQGDWGWKRTAAWGKAEWKTWH